MHCAYGQPLVHDFAECVHCAYGQPLVHDFAECVHCAYGQPLVHDFAELYTLLTGSLWTSMLDWEKGIFF